MRLSGWIEWWGKAMISGFRFEKMVRDLEKNNNEEDRERGAPFERRIC